MKDTRIESVIVNGRQFLYEPLSGIVVDVVTSKAFAYLRNDKLCPLTERHKKNLFDYGIEITTIDQIFAKPGYHKRNYEYEILAKYISANNCLTFTEICDIISETYLYLWKHAVVCSDKDILFYFQEFQPQRDGCDLSPEEYKKRSNEIIRGLIKNGTIYSWGNKDSYVKHVHDVYTKVDGVKTRCISAIEYMARVHPNKMSRDVSGLLEYDLDSFGRYAFPSLVKLDLEQMADEVYLYNEFCSEDECYDPDCNCGRYRYEETQNRGNNNRSQNVYRRTDEGVLIVPM